MPHDLTIRELGSFLIGGSLSSLSGLPEREVKYASDARPLRFDPNGTYTLGQIYVQFVRLAAPKWRFPVAFLSGGTSTGAIWENTPDGRHGWQMLFLSAGFDTYIADTCGKGRASLPPPGLSAGDQLFRPHEETWRLLRIGKRYSPRINDRHAYPNTKFPVAAFDEYTKQVVPRFVGQEATELAALRELLQKIGPAVIVAQSSGGYLACTLAQQMPTLIKAIVTVEMTAAPAANSECDARLASVPQIILWGDNWTDDPTWVRIRSSIDNYVARLRKIGGDIELLDLPEKGLLGNSHQIMMDLNNHVVAEKLFRWLDERLAD